MSHRRLLRPLGLVALALALIPSLAPPVFGAARAGKPARPAVSAWSGAGAWLTGAWKTVECLFLPGGRCTAPGGEQPSSDYGCIIDPNGKPHCDPSGLTQPGGDYGCGSDPNGVRRCGEPGGEQPSSDYGCGIDPDGVPRCSGG